LTTAVLITFKSSRVVKNSNGKGGHYDTTMSFEENGEIRNIGA